MRRENNVKPGPQKEEWEDQYGKMLEFCDLLARKDLEFTPGLSMDALENVLRMQGIRRYLLSNSLERAYELFYEMCIRDRCWGSRSMRSVCVRLSC